MEHGRLKIGKMERRKKRKTQINKQREKEIKGMNKRVRVVPGFMFQPNILSASKIICHT